MKRGPIIAIVIIVALVGYLLWSTLGSQRVQCRACVAFAGQRNCATASAASREEAARSAQNTACGPIARSMDESIACGNQAPLSVECGTLQ